MAALLAKVMHQVGFRASDKPAVTTANDILGQKDPLAFFNSLIAPRDASGAPLPPPGMVVIDEVGTFDPSKPGQQQNDAAKVLARLMEVSETLKKSMSFVLIGYAADIERVLGFNEGMPGRFPYKFKFEDFSEAQLKNIYLGCVRAKGYALQSTKAAGMPLARTIAARMALQRGRKGFANARTCANYVDDAIKANKGRLGTLLLEQPALPITAAMHATLLKADVLGVPPDLEASPLLAELNGMIGIPRVKAAVRGLMDLQLQNLAREERGDKRLAITLHKVFTGNPGTGKTTVARIYGDLLKEFGLLSEGGFTKVTASDLMGVAVGEAASLTAAALKGAQGKVLLIDEAYVLDPASGSGAGGAAAGGGGGGAGHGKAVLDTLVEKLDAESGADIAVILAGYPGPMASLFRNANEGLASRFSPADAIHFDDFSDAELAAVLKRYCRGAGLTIEPATVSGVVTEVARGRRQDGFANARAISTALDKAKRLQSSRLEAAARAGQAAGHLSEVILTDFFSEEEQCSASRARKVTDGLVATPSVEAMLEELDAELAEELAAGKSAASVIEGYSYIFTGPPGVGAWCPGPPPQPLRA